MCELLKIVTWNMRYVYNDGDGINNFVHRFGMAADKIIHEKPDVIAFQEIVPESLELLERTFPEYMFLGHFKKADYVSGGGIFTAIKKETLGLVALETFWLSPAPYISGTRFEDQSSVPRICVMTQVRHKQSGKIIRTFNLQLDHISEKARVLGLKCVLDFAQNYNKKIKFPMIVMGDFNAEPKSEVIELCGGCCALKDATNNIECTFHDFGNGAEKIDYIFLSDELSSRVESAGIWNDVSDGIYLSDHYPVYVNVEIER